MSQPAAPTDTALPGFLRQAGRIINAGVSRAVVLSGNVHDLQPLPGGGYAPLPDALREAWNVPGCLLLTYELNGPIRFQSSDDRDRLQEAWRRWRLAGPSGDRALARLLEPGKGDQREHDDGFNRILAEAIGRPTAALEALRQCCLCARQGQLEARLIIVIEGADLIIPEAPIHSLSDSDRQRVHICHDWFSDPGFLDGDDSVLLLAESKAQINSRIIGLPQVVDLPVPMPDTAERERFLNDTVDGGFESSFDHATLARITAGLSLQALRQLTRAASHSGHLNDSDVVAKIAESVAAQLGEDVVSFSRPSHTLDDVVGNRRLKAYLRDDFLPRLSGPRQHAPSGAAVSGPIGAGKTFIFEALAAEVDAPVIELKNIRSQWFGQTDVILERLRRVLLAMERVVIVVDEADTQFGRLDGGSQDTERRLTGKIQAMMSDQALRGRVIWLLMTARIHRLSPDLRRPGRVGDLIIPVLDPEDIDDRIAFCQWIVSSIGLNGDSAQLLADHTADWSAAAYASLRTEATARSQHIKSIDDLLAIVHDLLPAEIASTRRYQTLQALLNCTRRSLLPHPDVDNVVREAWRHELASLEAAGQS